MDINDNDDNLLKERGVPQIFTLLLLLLNDSKLFIRSGTHSLKYFLNWLEVSHPTPRGVDEGKLRTLNVGPTPIVFKKKK